MPRSRIIAGIVIVVALSALGYWAYLKYGAPVETAAATPASSPAQAPDGPEVVSAEGRVVPAREADLAFRMSGRVEAIRVRVGDEVKVGDVLVELESADLEAAVAQALAALDLAKANRDTLLAGARPEEIKAAEQRVSAATAAGSQAYSQLKQLQQGATADRVAAAEAQLAAAQAAQKEAQIAYDKIIENIKFLAGPTEEQARFNLNAANEAVAAAQAALDQVMAGADAEAIEAAQAVVWAAGADRNAAAAQLDLMKAGATDAQRAAADAQVAAAEAGLAAAQAALDQVVLRAPFDGVIASLNLEIGEVVAPAAPVIKLADLGRWRVETDDLSETDVVLVTPGQPATITLDAFPDRAFHGQVREIASTSETNRGNVTYRVTIDLDPDGAPVRWGMTAFADIEVR